MTLERSDLATGTTVVTEQVAGVRSVTLGLWFRIGSRDEAPDHNGAAHFLEHLLFKGTTRRSAQQIAAEIEAVGGDLNAFTSREYTCFYARVLDLDLGVAADVLSDMATNATNRPEDVESERHVVLEEINIHLDSPDDLVHSEFARALLGDHPLAAETLGTPETISAMTRDTLHRYYLERYRPETLVVAAAGNVTHDRVVTLVEETLGDLGRPGGARPVRHQPDRYLRGRVLIRHRPTEQAHIVLGGPAPDLHDERRWAVRVLNGVLGGGMSSRLFQEVRERRGLAYATYSYVSSYTDAGYYGAYAGTAPGRVEETLKVVRDVLDRLPDELTAEEVERAKGNLTGSIVLSLEDTGSRMNRLGKMAVTDVELLTVEEVLRRIDAVDLDQVRTVARDLLAPPRTLAVVGPFGEEDRDRFAAYVDGVTGA